METIRRTKVVDLLKRRDFGAMVNVKGWVRTRRGSKQVNFIALNDGSTINNVQIVVDLANFDEDMLKLITTGACLSVNGELVESVGSGQACEIQAREIEVLGSCDNTYPLQKKGHSMEFLREIAHLRPRTNTFGAVFRIRHNMAIAIHRFFHEKGFFYFHTPIITASDCEGAGQMFQVTTMNLYDLKKDENGSIIYDSDFFGKQASLTVSGQLEGELAATSLGSIYTFGPTFRAENSNTPRHLAEFWMVEPEVAFADLQDLMDLEEEFIKYCVNWALENCKDDLEFLNKMVDKGLIERLQNVVNTEFVRLPYTEGVKILEEAVSTALELASGKSDGAEVAVSKTTGISVSTRYGEVENVEFNSDGALGITVYHQNRKGSASSTDLSPQAIARTVQAALDIARYTSPDPYAGVADKELLAFDAPDLDLFHPADVSPDEAIELAARAEQAALQADKRITNTEGGSFNSHYGVKVFGNSHGMLQGYCSTRHSLSSCVIAEENGDMERDYAYTIGRAMSDLQTPEWVGADCARRTLSRLSPRKLSTMKAPVIFANEVATGLFGHLVGAIAGGAVYRKSTFLLDSLGKQILPDWLTIEEHPHLLKGLASTPFDSEGVRTERRDIVKDGILTQWLLTSYSARKLGLKSTGHAGGIHNWRIAGQGLSFEQMLKEMGTGLVVTELMGQGVSAITGDYSRGAAGFWVENGEIQYPVSEITIAGNLKDMWRNIVTVGNDIETRSNIQCGSVLLPEMKIAGQ